MILTQRRNLELITSKLKALEDNLEEQNTRRRNLEEQQRALEEQFARASKLRDQLRSEAARWSDRVENLRNMHLNLIGDVVLCAASITYLGAFRESDRLMLLEEWKRLLEDETITCAPAPCPVAVEWHWQFWYKNIGGMIL